MASDSFKTSIPCIKTHKFVMSSLTSSHRKVRIEAGCFRCDCYFSVGLSRDISTGRSVSLNVETVTMIALVVAECGELH